MLLLFQTVKLINFNSFEKILVVSIKLFCSIRRWKTMLLRLFTWLLTRRTTIRILFCNLLLINFAAFLASSVILQAVNNTFDRQIFVFLTLCCRMTQSTLNASNCFCALRLGIYVLLVGRFSYEIFFLVSGLNPGEHYSFGYMGLYLIVSS